mgnify:CR=1 FL=1|jgi:hypothetical protein
MGIETIKFKDKLFAIIIRRNYIPPGLNFVTNDKDPLQVGIHNVNRSKKYKAHYSLPFKKLNELRANKIYYIRKGRIKVDFYDENSHKFCYSILVPGDLVLFLKGGHGIKILNDSIMIEIKQGPYRGAGKEKRFIV